MYGIVQELDMTSDTYISYKLLEKHAAITISRRAGGAWCVENYKHTALGKTLEEAFRSFLNSAKT